MSEASNEEAIVKRRNAAMWAYIDCPTWRWRKIRRCIREYAEAHAAWEVLMGCSMPAMTKGGWFV